jgi:hypothetical protein
VNPGVLVTDRGMRFASAHNVARMVGGTGKWIASRLSDGGTDGIVYDTMDDARRHQLHESQCYYCQVQPGHMTDREASQLLNIAEKVYDSGGRFLAPDTVAARMGVDDQDFRKMLARGLLGIAEPVR